MRVTIDGVAYVVTQKQCQQAFELVEPNCVHATRLIASLTPARNPGRSPSYTEKQAAEAREMRLAGYTRRAIAETLGLSVSCVNRLTQEGGE